MRSFNVYHAFDINDNYIRIYREHFVLSVACDTQAHYQALLDNSDNRGNNSDNVWQGGFFSRYKELFRKHLCKSAENFDTLPFNDHLLAHT